MNKRYSLIFAAFALAIFVSIWVFNSVFLVRNEEPAAEIAESVSDQSANTAPEISINNPIDNLTVTRGKVVNIIAAVTDNNKIEKIRLFINESQKIETKANSLDYSWDTADLSPGQYDIKVWAEDGEKSSDKTVTVFVAEPVKIPVASFSEQEPTQVASHTEKADNSKPVNQTPNKNGTPTVSRGNSAADTSKYPLLSKDNGIYGQFRYKNTTGGRIEVDPQWVAENIVTITLPGLNQKVQVHKEAADNFMQAFNYIKNGTAAVNGKNVSLLSLIKTMDGTYVTRHVNWDPSRGLSNHSWGTAIDINANGHFGYVDPGNKNDPNLILWEKAFKPAGFSWGNSYGDSMHFELLK